MTTKPPITSDQISVAIRGYHLAHGRFPSKKTVEPVLLANHDAPDTWSSIDFYLRRGGRGLSGGSTLAQFVERVAQNFLSEDQLAEREARRLRLTRKQAIREQQRLRSEEHVQALRDRFGDAAPRGATVRISSYEELLVSQGDLDAIITDPPYERVAYPIYERLAELAAKALKPNGLLAVMTGQVALPEILAPMSAHVPFRWVLAHYNRGLNSSVRSWKRRILSA